MKTLTTVNSPTTTDTLNGTLRRYLNKNWEEGGMAGKWLFGALPDRYSPDGLEWVWTDDERQAVADNGAIATLLGLGSSEAVSMAMVSTGGTSGASATKWDSILRQVPGGTHATNLMCRRSNKRSGGKFDAIRADGARVELLSVW